ncbi:MAG: GNAT family N-acetyltransferase [Ilumatobacteraceae bacterium]
MSFLPIETERLRIRAMTVDDAPVFAAYRSEPAVARYQSWTAPYPLESARRLIEEQPSAPTAGDWIQLAIEHDGQMIGDVAVGLSADGKVATIGYTLASAHQGAGMATEAVGAIVDRLLDGWDVHRVEASVDPRNVASAQVVERLGFDFEGTAVSSVWSSGEWCDDDRYALTAAAHDAWRGRSRLAPTDVRLIEVTPDNVHDVRRLCTHHSQERFVSPMAGSFADALAPEVYDGAPVVPWLRGIEADGEIVGFMMLAERTAHHPEAYLWRLLVDRRHQRRGIGWRAVTTLIEQLRADGHASLGVSWVPDRGGPEPMYRKLGFVPTGELDGTEVVARLDLAVATDSQRSVPANRTASA